MYRIDTGERDPTNPPGEIAAAVEVVRVRLAVQQCTACSQESVQVECPCLLCVSVSLGCSLLQALSVCRTI